MTDEPTYILAGYLRFIVSDKPGVVAEVISPYAPGWAYDSDVPVFRLVKSDGGTLTKDEYVAFG